MERLTPEELKAYAEVMKELGVVYFEQGELKINLSPTAFIEKPTTPGEWRADTRAARFPRRKTTAGAG